MNMIPPKEDIQRILKTIKEHSSYDLENYSMNSIGRRFGKILMDLNTTSDVLISEMKKNSGFIEDIIKRVTVNTTELFRDPAVWVNFRKCIMHQFKDHKEIKIWHPGCSTGQEIFSMMILLDDMGWLGKAKIFASDINRDVIETARKGEYKLRLSKEYQRNFDKTFNPENRNSKLKYEKYFQLDYPRDKIVMKDFLVKKPRYEIFDLVKDENPFNEVFDIIVCRNVIIYFNYELQNRVLNLFYNHMNQNSCLMLGLHESIIGPYAGKFLKKEGLYLKN